MDGDDSVGGECLSVPLLIKTRKGPRRERQKACEGTAACEQRKEKVAGDEGEGSGTSAALSPHRNKESSGKKQQQQQ